MTIRVRHTKVSGGPVNPNVLVDGHDWDADHAVTGVRETLSASRVYYVRTDGSDSNDGLSNSSSGAFLTPQMAVTALYGLDLAGFSVTINLVGSFTTGLSFWGQPLGIGSGKITVTTPSTASLTVTDRNCIEAGFGASITVTGSITLQSLTASTFTPACLSAFAFGRVAYGGLTFKPSVGPLVQAGFSRAFEAGVQAYSGGGTCEAISSYTITAGAYVSHMHCTAAGAQIQVNSGVTVTFTGVISFSAYHIGMYAGFVLWNTGSAVDISGATVTGRRFYVHNSASLDVPTGASWREFLPGDLPGDTVAGGNYTNADSTLSDFGIETVTSQATSTYGTPVTGRGRLWYDATTKRFRDINDAGTQGTTVVPGAVAGQFISAINADGTTTSANGLTALGISGTGGAGFLTLQGQSSNPAAPGVTNVRLFSNSANQLSWIKNDGFARSFSATLTADRVYTLLDASGTLAFDITGTNIAPSTINLTGGQIAFPASQSASAGANTLDDYEEGTGTPVLAFGGLSTGITYSTQELTYTKVGNLVTATINIVLTSKGSATGSAQLTGLPFTIAKTAAVTISINNGAASMVTQIVGTATAAGTLINLQRFAAGAITNMADTDFNNNTVIRVTAAYLT